MYVETPAGELPGRVLLDAALEPLSLALTQAHGGVALHSWGEVTQQDWWLSPVRYTLPEGETAPVERVGEAHHAGVLSVVRAPVDEASLELELHAVDIAGKVTRQTLRP